MEETTKTSRLKTSKNLKNKRVLGVIAAVVLVLVVVGGFLFMQGSSSDTNDGTDIGAGLPTLSPEDIGMVVTVRDDNLALMFELTKADDIESVEYTIEYEAKTDEGVANQGIFGEMNIGEDGITKTDFREFGTCSAGKCRYDEVISDITINLKVTKTDGKEYQVQKVVPLNGSEEE